MAEADGEPTTAPGSPRAQPRREWLAPNRRARQELIRKNRRLAEEAKAAQRRPGFNVPPITDAEVAAYWQRKREDIDALLNRAQITHPVQRLLWREILASARHYQGGGNVVEAALWTLDAILRFHEPPGATLRELDALAHVHRVRNALRDAVAGKLAPLLALLPKREHLEGGAAPLSTADYHRVCIAAGVEGLTRQGGFTQKVATSKASVAFGKHGISVTPGSALEFFKRIRRRGANADEREVFKELTANAPRTRPEREAWLNQLAEIAGRIFET